MSPSVSAEAPLATTAIKATAPPSALPVVPGPGWGTAELTVTAGAALWPLLAPGGTEMAPVHTHRGARVPVTLLGHIPQKRARTGGGYKAGRATAEPSRLLGPFWAFPRQALEGHSQATGL